MIVTPVGFASDNRIGLALRRSGKTAPLGEFALGDREIGRFLRRSRLPRVLQLQPADVLEKTVILPLAAQADLYQVLTFEMDRETPFTADELYWTHRVEAIDRQNGQLIVRLLLKPKGDVEPLLTGLRAVELTPRWIEVLSGSEEGSYLPLDNKFGPPRDRSGRLLAPLALACGLLVLVACANPFLIQSLELARIDRELAIAQSTAAEAVNLRSEIDRLSRGAALINGEMNKVGRPLETLENVTRKMPDDTYLTELELRQRKLTLTGRSGSAARLIGMLAANGLLHDPAFAAPVTRLEDLHAEVFTIVAEVGSEL